MNKLKSFIVLYNGKFIRVYKQNEVDTVIAKLKTENESLVKCCKEYDSRQRIDERRISRHASPRRYLAFELLSQKSSLIKGDRVHIHAYVSRLNRDNPSERWIVLRI